MPRNLSEKDRTILVTMAPEWNEEICAKSEHEFRSVLPPIALHYSTSAEDFGRRLARINDDDLGYLARLIIEGTESVACLPPEYLSVLIDAVAERIGRPTAGAIYFIYEDAVGCDPSSPRG